MNEPKRVISGFPPQPVAAHGLTVARGEHVLFSGLGFEVAPGGVLLLRGPNGAGKSTLLLTLAGIVRPEAGAIEGFERTELHLLGYQSGLKARLTVGENLAFWQAMNGGGGISADEALAQVGIGALAVLEAGYLSSGQLRRLALARLLVSPRRVWLLDEPSATLDAEGEVLLAALIDEHRTAGGIAIVATHHDLRLSNAAAGVQTVTLGGTA
jgi:heme exporter protein A